MAIWDVFTERRNSISGRCSALFTLRGTRRRMRNDGIVCTGNQWIDVINLYWRKSQRAIARLPTMWSHFETIPITPWWIVPTFFFTVTMQTIIKWFHIIFFCCCCCCIAVSGVFVDNLLLCVCVIIWARAFRKTSPTMNFHARSESQSHAKAII